MNRYTPTSYHYGDHNYFLPSLMQSRKSVLKVYFLNTVQGQVIEFTYNKSLTVNGGKYVHGVIQVSTETEAELCVN